MRAVSTDRTLGSHGNGSFSQNSTAAGVSPVASYTWTGKPPLTDDARSVEEASPSDSASWSNL
jgi:hypothetical protein